MESGGVGEVRQNARGLLRRAEAGEAFQVTDRGRPVAVLVGTAEALRVGVGGLVEALVASGAYPDAEAALADGVAALARRLRSRLVDAAVVDGYTRVPQEADAWVEEASELALSELGPW